MKERYQMLKEMCQEKYQNEKYSIANENICNCCQAHSHETHHCPYISVNYPSQSIIKRFIFKTEQKRQPINKNRIKKYSTILRIQETRSRLRQKRIDFLANEQSDEMGILEIYEDLKYIEDWEDKIFYKRLPVIKIYENDNLIDYESEDIQIVEDEEEEKIKHNFTQAASLVSPDIKTNKTTKTNKTGRTSKYTENSQNSVEKSNFNRSESSELASIHENMKKQQSRLSSKDIKSLQQSKLHNRDSKDSKRRISDLIYEEMQKQQQGNVSTLNQMNRGSQEPQINSFILQQSPKRVGNSSREIHYQPQSSKNIGMSRTQNSLSNSQRHILQGGIVNKKSEMYNQAQESTLNFRSNLSSIQEKQSDLKNNYNSEIQRLSIQDIKKTKKISSTKAFDIEFDRLKEFGIFFPSFNYSNVLLKLNQQQEIFQKQKIKVK